MVARAKSRMLVPGSTGWTVSDLDDPAIRRQWESQHVEMVHGVIAQMPAAFFDHGHSVDRLFDLLKPYFESRGIEAEFGTEVDVVVDESVLYRADGVVLLPDDVKRQLKAQKQRGEPVDTIRSLLVTPTLLVESVSQGHESADTLVKHRDYGVFGAPNYWIINHHDKTLECYKLVRRKYVLDAKGESPMRLHPSAFDGLVIPLKKVFR